jgi:hypothetical protein
MPRNPSYLGSNSQAGSLKAVGHATGTIGAMRGSDGAVLVAMGRNNLTLPRGPASDIPAPLMDRSGPAVEMPKLSHCNNLRA